MPDEVFGPLVTRGRVERWARDTLLTWHGTYLAWACRELERDPAAVKPIPPRAWVPFVDAQHWPRLSPPSCMIVCSGLDGAPVKDGNKSYRADWALSLLVVVAAKGRESADSLAEVYAASLRTLLIQRGSLGGHAEATTWLDERFDVLDDQDDRTQLSAVRLDFNVEVRDVARAVGGPALPDPPTDPLPPYPDEPRVTDAEVDVRAEEA